MASPTFTIRGTLFSTSNASSYAETQTYTPTANTLLIAFVVGGATASPTSVAGHGVTWTKLTLSANAISTTHWVDVYVALSGGSPSSAAFTLTYGASQTGAAIIVYEVNGANLSGTAAQAIKQNPTNTGTATSGSVTLAAGGLGSAQIAFFVHLANEVTNPRSGWTEDTTIASDGNFNTPATGAEAQWRADGTFETTASATWSTSALWRGVALEVLAAPPVPPQGTLALTGLAPTVAYQSLTGPVYLTPFTVQPAQITGTLTDYPVLVSITDARFKSVANGGHVLRVEDLRWYADGQCATALSFERESYDPTTGTLLCWVKVPAAAVGTTIYLAYGDSAATADLQSTAPWQGRYQWVQHLPNGTTLSAPDSTVSGNTGILVNGPTAAAGQIDGGALLANASNQYIYLAGGVVGFYPLSFTAWVKQTAAIPTGFQQTLVAVTNSNGGPVGENRWVFSLDNRTGVPAARLVANTTPSTFREATANFTQDTAWHLWHGVLVNATTFLIYRDGVSLTVSTSGSAVTPSSITHAFIGAYIGDQTPTLRDLLDGTIDEVRVENVARSAAECAADFNNQSAPATFWGGLQTEQSRRPLGYVSLPVSPALALTGLAPTLAYRVTTIALAATALALAGPAPTASVTGAAPPTGQLYVTPATVATGQITGTVTDLLGVVDHTDPNFKSVVNGGHVPTAAFAYNLIPYADAALTTKLKFARFLYDATTGHVIDIVRLPSAAVGTTIYYGYGDSTIVTDQSDLYGTFNFAAAAWEFGNGSTLDLVDVSGHGYTLNNSSSPAMLPAGGLVSGSALNNVNDTGSNGSHASIGIAPPGIGQTNTFTILFSLYLTSGYGGVVASNLEHNDTQWQGHYVAADASAGTISVASVLNNFAVAGAASQAITFGQWTRCAAVIDGAAYRRMYVNGVGGTAETTSVTPNQPTPQFSIACSYRSGGSFDNHTPFSAYDNVYLLPFRPTDAWLDADAHSFTNQAGFWTWGTESPVGGGGTPITIAVPAGTLTLAGLAPALTLPLTLTPAPGALALTGLAPALALQTAVALPAGTLSLGGPAPAVAIAVRTTLALPAGALALTGLAPTLATAIRTTITLPAGTLALTGPAPSLALNVAVSLPAGTLTLAGPAPVLATAVRTVLAVPAGTLALAGPAPFAGVSAGAAIPVGQLALVGPAPVAQVFVRTVLPVAEAPLTLAGPAPVAAVAVRTTIAVSPAALALVGPAPLLSLSVGRAVPAGSLALTGLAPALALAVRTTLDIAAAPLALTGLAPSAAITFGAGVPVGTLALTGRAPSLATWVMRAVPATALALVGRAPAVGIRTGTIVGPGLLTLAGSAPSLIYRVVVSPATGVLMLAGPRPTVILEAIAPPTKYCSTVLPIDDPGTTCCPGTLPIDLDPAAARAAARAALRPRVGPYGVPALLTQDEEER